MTNRIGQATPGPWFQAEELEPLGGCLSRLVMATDGGVTLVLFDDEDDPAAEANANLIAAAPDMFEALELVEPALVAAVAEADAGGPNEGLDLLCGFVKRALAKARGEQPAREQVL
jgi:hypothetical protein